MRRKSRQINLYTGSIADMIWDLQVEVSFEEDLRFPYTHFFIHFFIHFLIHFNIYFYIYIFIYIIPKTKKKDLV